mmetsp:Transcript_39903/g.52221  ORF Transcript_39903/g.52221 Transcript_39903/m.52221 type:complete len:126 (-) Transcript_39903:403-780(-)
MQEQEEARLVTILNNWRAEYDHPCVVSKSRRKVAITMNDVFQDVNDWEQFANDVRIQGLLNLEDYPKNSAMYKINSYIGSRSPEQQQKNQKSQPRPRLGLPQSKFCEHGRYVPRRSKSQRVFERC